ncbi:MAG TPA: PfkB family carbohydrate kinase [Candidatus Acidoferrales bacterium]|jgi:sugar/nucleoside kinase (ribokinase family)|nr:PfkB family carbohydrate kinase [Candidatus Acidoferrales bacterium]
MSAKKAKSVDVVGVGINATDTLIRLPRFPALDSKVEFISSAVLPGGQVASAMVACQKWGIRTRYVGRVGDDSAGELQRKEFKKAGVDAHLKVIRGAQSQTSFILVDEPSGERTVLWNRSAEMTIRPADLERKWVVDSRALLVDGHDTKAAATAARWAHEDRIPVTADLDNLYSGVEVLLEYVDFLVCSKEFPARLTGEKDLHKALPAIHERFGNRVAAATLGRDGVIAWDGTRFHYRPAFVVNAVDTTGAGDVFHGAFVYAQLVGMDLDEQLAFSCAAAALNCKALGARGGIAPLKQIRELLRTGKTYPPLYPSSEFAT